MSNLLVVDFDSFFPNPLGDPDYDRRDELLYDWGHRESPLFIEGVWPTRAEGFINNHLPLPDLDGRERDFWSRFTLRKSAKLYYAESNAWAAAPEVTGRSRRWDAVWLYDAHHDSGYRGEDWLALAQEGRYSCENWMVLYRALGAVLHMRYPAWRAWALEGEPEPIVDVDRAVDDGSAPDVAFDRVFVCRSGAWVPPWHDIDARFDAFVQAAPVAERIELEPRIVRRAWDQPAVERQAQESLANRAKLLAAIRIEQPEATLL